MNPLSGGDVDRLKKFLALSTSEHDGEALSALRRANAILTRARIHWHEFVVAATNGHEPRLSADEEIDEAFDLALATSSGSFRTFMLDLLDQWQSRGSLSPKQRAAVLKAAQRAREAAKA